MTSVIQELFGSDASEYETLDEQRLAVLCRNLLRRRVCFYAF